MDCDPSMNFLLALRLRKCLEQSKQLSVGGNNLFYRGELTLEKELKEFIISQVGEPESAFGV